MKTNKALMAEAREALSGKWGLAVGGLLLLAIVYSAAYFTYIGILVVTGPIWLGGAILTLKLARQETSEVGDVFKGFSYFGKSTAFFWLFYLYQLLWHLLFVIGCISAIAIDVIDSELEMLILVLGILLALGALVMKVRVFCKFFLVWFIGMDEPKLGAVMTFKTSADMMKGYKWKFFCLQLRFIGWLFLSILTSGIGLLWVTPYILVSFAKFYEDVKADYEGDITSQTNQEIEKVSSDSVTIESSDTGATIPEAYQN